MKKKVTLRHSLDGEPGSSKSYPLEESSQETSSGSFRDGHSVRDSHQESPALSVVMHFPVLITPEQQQQQQPQTAETLRDTFSIDVPDEDENQTELPSEDKSQAASGTSCDSSPTKEDEAGVRDDNAL